MPDVKPSTQFIIDPLEVEIGWSDTTKLFTYNGAKQNPVAEIKNLCGEENAKDDCEAKLEITNVEGKEAGKDAGTYTVTVTGLEGTDSGNYKLPDLKPSTQFTVKPLEVQITWTNTKFAYDGKSHMPIATVSGLCEGDKCSVNVEGAGKSIGQYKATASLENPNYTLSEDKATITFVIYCAKHVWDTGRIITMPTNTRAGVFAYTCKNGCGKRNTIALPQKQITVTMGKSYTIPTNSIYKLSIQSPSKYKNYLTFSNSTGKIKTKKSTKYYSKLKSPTIKVTVAGTSYNITVKCAIPAPKVKVSKKLVKVGGAKVYKYSFKYNIKGAKKIQVRMVKGGSRSINKYLDRYVKKSKSNRNSYILYSKKTMKKLNNKVTFKITAYYGNKKSQTYVVTK